MALLEVENLEYNYGGVKAVKGVSFAIEEGEIVTLIGANGAGKSTTLRTISGLTSPSGVHGKIIFDGRQIQKMRGSRIAALGLSHVLEGRHIFPHLTVDENLHIGAYMVKNQQQVKSDVQAMYELFPRLLERRTSNGGNLSGGEQQMLAIARALMCRPKMILFDEPSLGLAPIIVTEIFHAIKKLNENGTTILFVEQNSRIALNTASRGYVMQNGLITLSDSCENLLKNAEVKKAYLGG